MYINHSETSNHVIKLKQEFAPLFSWRMEDQQDTAF